MEVADIRTRAAHCHKFKEKRACTNRFKYSMVHRTIPVWNSLPAAVAEAGSRSSSSSSNDIGYQEYSFPRLFVPWTVRSLGRSFPGTFVLKIIRSLEHLFPGPFVLWNFHSLELSFQVLWTFPAADRSCISIPQCNNPLTAFSIF